jgi:hypothetical protein
MVIILLNKDNKINRAAGSRVQLLPAGVVATGTHEQQVGSINHVHAGSKK